MSNLFQTAVTALVAACEHQYNVSDLSQEERIARDALIRALEHYGRGLDFERVETVVSFPEPWDTDAETYDPGVHQALRALIPDLIPE